MTRTLLWPSLLLLLLGSVCFWVTAAGQPGPSITFAALDEIKTLDIGAMSWTGDLRAAMGLWEGLASYDPQTLAPIPAVAESWEISPDGKTYTFHLRHSARWSNGDPVLARDFVFAWKRVMTPSTGADYGTMMFHIRGAEAYFNALADLDNAPAKAGEAAQPLPDFSKVGVETPDDYTLVVHLDLPCTYFLDLAAFPPFYPLHEKAMEPFLLDKAHPERGYDGVWTRPPNLVSNGPYKLVDWQVKRFMLMEPNPNYWDRAAVKCDRLKLTTYKDARAGFLAYQSGAVDVLSWVPPEFGEELLKEFHDGQRNDVQYHPTFGSYYYVFNCKRKPLDDARVRKALALSVDRKQIVDDVLRMDQTTLSLLVPPNTIKGYISPTGLGMDVAEAQRLLAEAGFPDGAGFPPLEMLYTQEGIHSRIAQAMGQMWQNNLHIRVTYRGLERSTFGSERQQHNFMAARGGWTGDYVDPTTWLDLARSNNSNNDGQYSNAHFDDLMRQSDEEHDPVKRFALLHDAEKLIDEDEVPFLTLYQYSDGYMLNPDKIAGCDFNVRMLTQFKYIRRKDAVPVAAKPGATGGG